MTREPNGIPAEDDDGSGGLRPPVGVHLDGLHSEGRGGFCSSAAKPPAGCLVEPAEKALTPAARVRYRQ